ncbi:unnamed protein product (macronuclear) [Paramecium tetraurelia]|uniref:RING-type domain-containing protein n=1 Tax=Paramecium tetraurelia TaxID=5888 RepID=A0CM36_PARTE|nr:uncharacterized protein GSPATT00008332001 [Paramecium tetraurelia]CAK71853.1 unnamed protein product [Paramecium tetraurelia]|eukprot:XP_001439250.1 hypothetical protein (macronuclear) [Paramecium tetraurelia strain d4-2]
MGLQINHYLLLRILIYNNGAQIAQKSKSFPILLFQHFRKFSLNILFAFHSLLFRGRESEYKFHLLCSTRLTVLDSISHSSSQQKYIRQRCCRSIILDLRDCKLILNSQLIAAFKSIGALQLVFVSLRITGQITWGWIQTLIIIWFLLGLSFVIAICLFIDLLQKCRNKLEGIEEDKKLIIIKGGIWLNLIAFGITILPFATLFGCALKLDFHVVQLNQYAFGLTILYYLLQLAYFYKFKSKLIDYFLYYDMAQSNLYVEQQIQQINQNQQQVENRIQLKMKRMHKISISKVPQFMVRLSQTYYRCAQNNDKQHKPSVIQQKNLNQIDNKYQMNDNDQSKRFDLLLSSPRQRLEISSSLGQDLTSRNSDKKQFEDQSQLKQEQQNQNSQKLCLVCYEKENNMINMPCGHGGFCKECCEQLLSKSELCYLCRKPVTHSLQIQEVQNRESLVEVIEVLEQQNY